MLVLAALLTALSAANPPPSSCLTAFGQTACGYDCKAAFGKVRCSNVPHGACHAAFGDVVCGPAHSGGGFAVAGWPKAECVSAFGQVACGYSCTSGFGEIGCAATPWGACVAAFGGVTCASGDASLVWASARGETIPPATCVSAFGKRACGWSCVAKRGEAGCGATPWSACDVQPDGRLVCSDPPMLVNPTGAHGAPW